ncbi:hypothetical protein BGZ95_008521, partial [Linnemannia exigua]
LPPCQVSSISQKVTIESNSNSVTFFPTLSISLLMILWPLDQWTWSPCRLKVLIAASCPPPHRSKRTSSLGPVSFATNPVIKPRTVLRSPHPAPALPSREKPSPS